MATDPGPPEESYESAREIAAVRGGLRPMLQLHPDTLVLAGCHLSSLREKLFLQPDQLAASMRRTTSWLLALERGECMPTRVQQWQLDHAFSHLTGQSLNYPRTLVDLEFAPYGRLATRLRQTHDLVRRDEGADDGDDDLVPMSLTAPPDERLLTAVPSFVLAILLGLIAWLQPWQSAGPRWSTPPFQDAAVLSPLVLIAFLLVGNHICRLIAAAGRLLRVGDTAQTRKDIDEARTLEEMPIEPARWVSTLDLAHMPRAVRTPLAQGALMADLLERCLGAIMVAASVATGIALAIPVGENRATEAWWVVIAGVLWLLALSGRRELEDLTDDVYELFVDGLGIDVPTSSESALLSSSA